MNERTTIMRASGDVAPTRADVSAVWEELSRLSRIARQHTGPLARALGLEIEGGALAILGVLAKLGPRRLGEVASDLGLSHSVASRHVASLEALGYVTRHSDANDRRAQVIALTDKGRAHLAQIREGHRRFLDDALADWNDDDIATLARLLRRFGADLQSAFDHTMTDTTTRRIR